jgi:hypothetical protein
LVGTPLVVGTPTGRVSSCETEVADFEFTVRVDQEVTRLEVAMDNVGGMNVLETAKGLINEGLEMSVREGLLGSDLGWRILSD